VPLGIKKLSHSFRKRPFVFWVPFGGAFALWAILTFELEDELGATGSDPSAHGDCHLVEPGRHGG
jgi:hypothetical protein